MNKNLNQSIQEIVAEIKNRGIIWQFYPRSVLQEAQSAKDIPEVDTGTLTVQGYAKLEEILRQSLFRIAEKTTRKKQEITENISAVNTLRFAKALYTLKCWKMGIAYPKPYDLLRNDLKAKYQEEALNLLKCVRRQQSQLNKWRGE